MIKVLDRGFIEVITHMGDDLMVVNTARVSFNKWHDSMTAGDKKLINYLADHGHWSPFAHPKIHLRIKMPIFVHRQWDKTRVGFDRNEVSRRYVDYEPEFYIPTSWRGKAENKKQGSSGVINDPQVLKQYDHSLRAANGVYQFLLTQGVAPEQARIALPLASYTEFIETGSLYGYARLYGLRASEDAQWEIREYAKAIDTIMVELFPVSWEALSRQKDLPEILPNDPAVAIVLHENSIEDILKGVREKKYTEARKVDGLNEKYSN